MGMTSCKACGGSISTDAAACPKCGHPQKKNGGCGTMLIFFLLLCVLLALLRSCGDSSNTTPVALAAPSGPPPTDAQVRSRWFDDLQNKSLSAGARMGAARSLLNQDPNTPEAKKAAELLPELEKAYKADQSAAAEQASMGQWGYESPRDSLTNKEYKLATVTSENLLSFDFPYQGLQHATLTLRSHPTNGKDVILRIEKGQIICSSYSCPISVVFDDSAPLRYEGDEPADNSSELVFIPAYSTFIKRLAKAKTVRIAFTVHQEGTQVAEFNVKGFDSARLKR